MRKVHPGRLDSFAFGCLHCDQPFEACGLYIHARNKLSDPLIGELQLTFLCILGRCGSELLEEAKVSGLQMPNIVDSIAHHSETRESQAEGKATPLLRVDVAEP